MSSPSLSPPFFFDFFLSLISLIFSLRRLAVEVFLEISSVKSYLWCKELCDMENCHNAQESTSTCLVVAFTRLEKLFRDSRSRFVGI